jgi:hypothetical protein
MMVGPLFCRSCLPYADPDVCHRLATILAALIRAYRLLRSDAK